MKTILLQVAASTEAISVPDSLKMVTENLIESVKDDPNAFLEQLGKSALEFGLKVLAALAIYIVGAFLIKWVKKLLKSMFKRRQTEGTLASFVSSLVTITLTVLLVILVVGALGVNTTSLAALLAAGGMAIGMALSGTVQNFAGGIMLLIFKPFKAGDFIDAQGYAGVVKEVSIVSTKIVTPDNRTVVIPNGALSNGNIDNYSTLAARRLDIDLHMTLDCDVEKCIATIIELASADSRIMKDMSKGGEAPFVALTAIEVGSIALQVRVWVDGSDYWPVRFDLNRALCAQLPQKGFNFAHPKMEVING